MLQYTTTEAKAKFSELLSKVAQGEEISITRMGKEAARIVPPKKKRSLLGCMKGKGPYHMSDDFNEWTDELDEMFYGSRTE